MSVCFVRFIHNLPNRTTVSRKLLRTTHVQPNRKYVRTSSCLCNLTRQCRAVNSPSVRYSSSSSSSGEDYSFTKLLDAVQYRNLFEPLSGMVQDYAESDTVLAVTEKLIQFHDMTGLHWWSVIVLSTIAMRAIVVLPFAVHQQHVAARYELVTEEVRTKVDKEVVQKVKELAKLQNSDQKQLTSAYENEMSERKFELFRKYNCHPAKLALLLFLQTPIWVTGSCVLRNLTYMQPIQDATAQIVHAEMKLNSFLWVHDLTVPDPYLPLLLTVGSMINVRLNVIARRGRRQYFEKMFIAFYSLMLLMMCGYAASLPSSIALYWTTSGWCALIQNLAFLSPRVRRLFRIPTTKSMRANPYETIANKFKGVYKFLKY